jgi:response regulator NasT
MYVWRKDPERLKAVLVDRRRESDPFLEALLFDKGLTIVERYADFADAAGQRCLPQSDLLVAVVPGEDGAAVAELAALTAKHPVPVLAVCDHDGGAYLGALVEAGATSVLCIGVGTDRVRAAASTAIATFDRIAALARRAEQAEQALEDRKRIERAKGILMRQRGISEPEAFRELQVTSMRRNESLRKVAETIIAAKELLG